MYGTKQRHILNLRRRVQDKLNGIQSQKEALFTLINGFVAEAESRSTNLLTCADTNHFMQCYVDVMQTLDRCFNTCELVTASAEDFIESAVGTRDGDSQMVADVSVASTIVTPVMHDVTSLECNRASSKVGDSSDNAVTLNMPCSMQVPQQEIADLKKHENVSTTNDRRTENKLHMESETQIPNVSKSEKYDEDNQLDAAPSMVSNKIERLVICKELLQQVKIKENSSVSENADLVRQLPRQDFQTTKKTFPSEEIQMTTYSDIKEQQQESGIDIDSIPETEPSEVSIVMETGHDYGLGPDLKLDTLPSGKTTPVIVSEICTPWYFYIERFGPDLNRLNESIRCFMDKKGQQFPVIANPVGGMVCLALFSKDKTFYRARIKKVLGKVDHGDFDVEVFYVDYGNVEKVKCKDLRELPEKFAELSSQAICCALANVAPSNKYGLWAEGDILCFRQYVVGQQMNCVPICRSSDSSFPHLVNLFFNFPLSAMAPDHFLQKDYQVKVNTLLINQSCAIDLTISEQISKLAQSLSLYEDFTDISSSRKFHTEKSSMSTPSQSCSGNSFLETDSKSKRPNSQNVTQTPIEVCTKSNNTLSSDQRRENSVDDSREMNILPPFTSTPIKGKITDSFLPNGEINKCNNEKLPVEMKSEVHVAMQQSVSRIRNTGSTCTTEEKCSLLENLQNSRISDLNMRQESTGDVETSILRNDILLDITALDSEKQKNSSKSDEPAEIGVPLSVETNSVGSSEVSSSNTEVVEKNDLDYNLSSQALDVMLSFIASPSDFFVHIVSMKTGKALDQLMKNLNRSFERLSKKTLQKLSSNFSPVVKDFCCAQFSEDKNYYRSIVLEIDECKSDRDNDAIARPKYRVFYLDFGDAEWLGKNSLYPLPKDLCDIPPLAIHCSLAFICPLMSEKGKIQLDSKSWSDTATKKFIALTGFEKKLSLHVVSGNVCNIQLTSDLPVLQVLLVDNKDEEICINLELIRLGFAGLETSDDRKAVKVTPSSPGVPAGWDPMSEDFLSIQNSYNIDMDDVGVAMVGYKAQDEKYICKFYSQYRDCWRGDMCPFKHVDVTSGITQDQAAVYAMADSQQELLPETGSWVGAEVGTILNPGHFYVVLPWGKKSLDTVAKQSNSEDGYGSLHNETETLEDLIDAMKENYSRMSSHNHDLLHLAPGEIVVSQYSNDSLWYRARVLVSGDEKIKVFYVDFGNTEWIDKLRIWKVEPQFMLLPFQAIECFLVDVEPCETDDWSSEAKKYFRELVDGKTLVAYIKSRSWSGSLQMELYDTSGSDDINISTVLVSAGFAQVPKTVLDPSSGQQSRRSSGGSMVMIPG